ncbi:MAG: hypothetical protein P1S60_10285, partial [Anaerolineae bacterium]|nr:hypothetical protein [Anaerolineae bacterium]
TWTFWVTNTGNSLLNGVQVTDNQLGTISCPQTSLVSGQGMVCEATGTAVIGQYSNTGTATGTPLAGADVADSDLSHYYGGDPHIVVEKFTNGEAAASAPGPFILVGHPVTWTYVVTNTGNIELTGVSVMDDQGVSVSCPQTVLQAGEGIACQAVGTAVEGQYVNNVTASGTGIVGPLAMDYAVSYYFGADPGITVTKYTKGLDITAPPGPILPATTAVTWTYAVSNTGNVTLTAVTVTDDQSVTVNCPQSILQHNESMVCSAVDLATPGQYSNVGSATGKPPGKLAAIFAQDTSYYFGFAPNPEISLNKLVNRNNANTAPGVYIEVGEAVTWTYEIANTGNLTVTNIVITDDLGTPLNAADDLVICTIPELGLYTTQICEMTGTADAGQYVNQAIASGLPEIGGVVTDTDVSYYYGSDPSIDLEKHTQGQDADTSTGPLVLAGETLTWTYWITNTGNVTLTNLTITDDKLGEIPCGLAPLAPSISALCEVTGIATAGQYTNTATVIGTPPAGNSISDSDDSHYFGIAPAIKLEKTTAGYAADMPPGPLILTGHPVTWTYWITNTGNIMLENISLYDNREGDMAAYCPATYLDAQASMSCTFIGTASSGQYTNVAQISGTPPVGEIITATDASSYYGVSASLALVMTTNGQNAETSPGSLILVSEPVDWTYTVTNTGNVTLTTVVVSDDHGVSVTCPSSTLLPEAAMMCTASGLAQPGQYRNEGTATGAPPVGSNVAASAANYYFGVEPGIHIEKTTNESDADMLPGPAILVGDPVTWKYTISNTGNGVLDNIRVMDDVLGAMTCPSSTLAPQTSMSCETTGLAVKGGYTNTGTVTATLLSGSEISAEDASHYFGAEPAITLRTSLWLDSAQDWFTDTVSPGPAMRDTSGISMQLTITNTGNYTLTAVGLSSTDVELSSCAIPNQIAPGAGETCTVTLPWTEGPQQISVNSTGDFVDYAGTPHTVTADDNIFYVGVSPAMTIQKSISADNGVTWMNAASPPGPYLLPVQSPIYSITLRNTGSVSLTAIHLVDNELDLSSCEVPYVLVKNGLLACILTGVWGSGQQSNVVTATTHYTDDTGTAVQLSTSDTVYYFGAAPGLDVEKSISTDNTVWHAANDEITAADVKPGIPLWWRITLTNTSNIPLDLTISDQYQNQPRDLSALCIPPPPQTMSSGASYTCSYSDTASIIPGTYHNVVSVVGYFEDAPVSSDADAAHYMVNVIKVYLPVVFRK